MQAIIERYRTRTGHYPQRVYFCSQRGIRLSGKPLGRPKKDRIADRKQEYIDGIDRIAVERELAHAKGSFGLGLIRTKLRETSQTAIALSIVALNIAHIGRILRALLECLTFFLLSFRWERNVGVIR